MMFYFDRRAQRILRRDETRSGTCNISIFIAGDAVNLGFFMCEKFVHYFFEYGFRDSCCIIIGEFTLVCIVDSSS